MPEPFSIPGTTAVVTGAAGGIGRALAERLLREGAARVVVSDLDPDRVAETAAGLGARAHPLALDVSDEAAVGAAVEHIERTLGPIDLWCSNAGIAAGRGLGDDADWDVSWRVHVLAHVYAVRALFPRMAARGRGHLLVTASAAGLLTQLDSAPYSVTKHGAVALAEWLAIRHADEGIGVSCLCPQGVNTAMTAGDDGTSATRLGGDYIEPEDVAESVVAALHDGRFLILPHPEAAHYERNRANDRDRWIGGMRRAWAGIRRAAPQAGPGAAERS
ncbi:SDR family oxidoreductase [Streptomonospora nanhaiensis]|uniref:NAD(P)-dependent dehydrogenase (Short-subunit alcohol dehydrogenase family) n=1 Tax=Streptomonospora nanhaiensis TaxID=1323731 RepID=A0A853BP19_9ACTN|nr:SDR family oxidoreductase [Streptomonospora nanhaiensis]MBV2361918.1 SDR family oxidoreductase [Streptomonospora nanhaiensis]NYI96261.1 NAD(P)-dependent dehydrogenase (short-subunit alcohol dehydrogenase family) [Streptomonospora nanhaiensis]